MLLLASAARGGALPELRVPRVADDAVAIDGLPDEAAWSAAAVVPLRNVWGDGRVPGQTVVRLLHSGTRLFVSFVCEDRELIATHLRRDDHTFRDDCVEVLLAAPRAPLHEGVNIEINPAGAWADVLFRYPNWLNYDWNPAGLQVAARITPLPAGASSWRDGYSVELALPFADLAEVSGVAGYENGVPEARLDFKAEREALREPRRLRANFARWHRPQNVLTVWSDPRRPSPHALELERYGWLVLE